MKQILDLEDVRCFSDDFASSVDEPVYKVNNEYLRRSGKSAYEMAIKEIHALEFVISQLTKKDPAEARPLQESINWIKHELDSRNTNDDLVNAIWFTCKRTQVLKDIYNLAELRSLVCFIDTILCIEEALFQHRQVIPTGAIAAVSPEDRAAYDRMDQSLNDFHNAKSDQYYVELPGNLWQVYLNSARRYTAANLLEICLNSRLEIVEDNRYGTIPYVFNKLSVLVRELSRLRF